MVSRAKWAGLALLLSACSTTGMAGQDPGPGPDTHAPGLKDLASFEQMIRTAVPAAGKPWTSALAFERKSVYLTFDDGPKPYATERVLDILDREGVKGTFFLIGHKAEKHPDIVKDMVLRGHTIGNHTYSHIMPWGGNAKRYVSDALHGRQVLEDIAGVPVPLMRPPGGNLRLLEDIEAAGMQPALWTTLSGDCKSGQPPAYLLSLIKMQEGLRPMFHYPMIVLMHDTSTRTAEALPRIIEFFRHRGYDFLADWSVQ
jgi:peptidoglycan/xylan/chitin deacetylase (PgdA/CDA1 family)